MPCEPKKEGGQSQKKIIGICHWINNMPVGEVPILTPLNGVRVFFTVFVILRDTTTPVTLDNFPVKTKILNREVNNKA
jgi:hypothetical protein